MAVRLAVCCNTAHEISHNSTAFLFEPLLGLTEAFGDLAGFWLAACLDLGEEPSGLSAAASMAGASLGLFDSMTANCPDPLASLSVPAAHHHRYFAVH